MSSTNKTTYYELPQFVDNDIFNPLVDDNDAYSKIDTALHNIANAEADDASEIVVIKSRLDSAEGDIDTLEAQNGNSVLTTTAQTLSGAINELDADTSALDGRLDIVEDDINNVSTGLKVKVATAENDIDVLEAQNGSEVLTTTAQTLSGAVNELNSDVEKLTLAVTPEMFGAIGDGVADDTIAIQSAIDYGYEHKLPIKLTAPKYLITSSLRFDKVEQTTLVFDSRSSVLEYTGNDYAILISRLSYSNLLFGTINCLSGGGIKIYSGEVNHDRCQYLNIEFNVIAALTNCIYGKLTDNANSCWISEIRLSKGHLLSGNYGVNIECDNPNGLSRWSFTEIGFEGVTRGVFFNALQSEIGECEFLNCRLQENITAFITSYGLVRGILCAFPSTYTISFDLTSIIEITSNANGTADYWKFIDTKGGVYNVTKGKIIYNGTPYSLSHGERIPANADLNDYVDVGNYYCISNADASTIQNSPTSGAFNLHIKYLNGAATPAKILEQKLSNDSGVEYSRVVSINADASSISYSDWVRTITSKQETETLNGISGLTIVIDGTSNAKAISIYGKPTSEMSSGSSYTAGVISNGLLRPIRSLACENIVTSDGSRMYIDINTNGTVTLVPRANFSSSTNTINMYVPFV